MARGKGRKNESTGKATVNRQLGEAAPEKQRETVRKRAREAQPMQKARLRRGKARMVEE